MIIELKTFEITNAITAYIQKQGIATQDKEIIVTYGMKRKGVGLTATVVIEAIDSQVKLDVSPATPANCLGEAPASAGAALSSLFS